MRIILLTIGLMFVGQASMAGTLIGHWCDRAEADNTDRNYLITLTREDDNSIVALNSFFDGNHFRETLEPGDDGLLKYPLSEWDAAYRLRADGALELHDDSGLLKTLPSIETDVDPSACFLKEGE